MTEHCCNAKRNTFLGGLKTWKLMTFVVALPGVAICWINAELKEKEEHEHGHRSDFIAYPHLRLRTKVVRLFMLCFTNKSSKPNCSQYEKPSTMLLALSHCNDQCIFCGEIKRIPM